MMVDEDVEWLDVSVHDALRVDVIQPLTYHSATSKSFLM